MLDEITTINGTGKIKDIDKFDATFFNAHPKLAEHTDPMTRICLERSIEAIIDAGLSPADLYGSNTAVITGSAISTSEMYGINSRKNSKFSMLGRSKAMQANRLSYALNLSGKLYAEGRTKTVAKFRFVFVQGPVSRWTADGYAVRTG